MNEQSLTNKLTREQKDQRLYCFAIGLLLSFMPFTLLFNGLCNEYIYKGFIYDTFLCYGLVWLVVGFSICKCFTNLRFDMWVFIALFGSVWAYTYMCMPINRYFMYQSYMDVAGNPLYQLYMYAFPGYILIRCINDYTLLENTLRKFSVATVWASIILFLFNFYVHETQIGYMVFSYNMLPHITFLALGNSEKHTRRHRLLGYIGLVFVLILGCRGALVGFFVSFLCKLFFEQKATLTKIVQFVTICILLVVTVFFFESIVSWLVEFANFLGFDSRTLTYLQQGRFFEDSGREAMQRHIFSELTWTGHGMYGDRLTDKYFGSYAHNVIIEFLNNFGYVGGSILSVMLIYFVLKGLFIDNSQVRLLVIIFLASGFVKLLFSSSYLSQEPSFYILLGLCASKLQKNKTTNEVAKNEKNFKAYQA